MGERNVLVICLTVLAVALVGCAEPAGSTARSNDSQTSWKVSGAVSGLDSGEVCTITLTSDAGKSTSVRTDSADKFMSSNLEEGNYLVTADCDGGGTAEADLLVDSDRYVLLDLANHP